MNRMVPERFPVEGVKLKLARAQEHLKTLYGEWEAFGNRQPYVIADECKVQERHHAFPNGMLHVFRIHVQEQVPATWSILVGDCLQNMRAALDHLAWALAKRNLQRQPPTSTSFPIRPSDAAYHQTYTTKSGATKYATNSGVHQTRNIEAGAQTVIEDLQPYQGWNGLSLDEHPLWMLNELAKIDRHRVLHIVGAVNQETTVSVGRLDESGVFHIGAPLSGGFAAHIKTGPFKDGTEIGRFGFGTIDPEVGVHLNALIPIVFGSDPWRDELVIETLEDIYVFILDEVLTKFSNYI
jgi:hypothetical protein